MPTSDTMDISPLAGGHPEPMPPQCPIRLRFWTSTSVAAALPIAFLLAIAPPAQAQISLTTAVDLALRSSPRVQGAQADVDKTRAQLSEAHDAYIPSITAGAGLGQSYGYSPNPPTLFTVSAGSLVFSSSQTSYIRSARAGLNAAELALEDAREAVAQDAALAFITLDHDQQRAQAVGQQAEYANALVTIVQERADAGQDSQVDLTQAKLTAAELRVAILKAQDDTAYDREHLARLVGLPALSLVADSSFPSAPVPLETPADSTVHGYANSAVASAFASAEARQQMAQGDSTFRFRPQINLIAQFNYYATFSESFAQLQKVYQLNSGSNTTLGAEEGVFGVQISIPVLDKGRAAKARQSAADASRAFHDAQGAQMDALDGQSRLRHSISELQAQGDVAALHQQLAQQQLDVTRLQLQSGTGDPNGPQMTPKDEQKARIAERDKYLAVIDANFQLHQAEIQLLRQSGGLESWLKSAGSKQHTPQNNLPASSVPQP